MMLVLLIGVIQAFFQRWWRDQSEAMQTTVKRLVESGQLELMYVKINS